MAASKEGLIDNINCKLTTGGLTDMQASQLAGAAQALCCSSFYAVACETCLPNAALNKGRFVYLQDQGRYVYSDGGSWTSNFSSLVVPNIYAWGYNVYGELGNGTTSNSVDPISVLSSDGVCWNIPSAGRFASAAIKTDGTLWTWGANSLGALGDGTTTNRCSPGTVAGGGTTWCAISIDCRIAGAIKTDGTLWTWGYDAFGGLGAGAITSRLSPGTVAGGGTNWCRISMSNRTGAGVKTDGSLWTWGIGTFGVLGSGSVAGRNSPVTVAGGGTNWCAVDVSSGYSMAAIKTDGTLWTWGANTCGRLGDGTTTNRSSPGTVAGGGTNWRSANAGLYHTAAIKSDGTLWTWGYNNCGQLGNGTITARCSPGTVAGGGTNWCAASANDIQSTLALKTDGTLWTWGKNTCGELGTGNTVNRSSPGTTIKGTDKWLKAEFSYHALAIVSCKSGF